MSSSCQKKKGYVFNSDYIKHLLLNLLTLGRVQRSLARLSNFRVVQLLINIQHIVRPSDNAQCSILDIVIAQLEIPPGRQSDKMDTNDSAKTSSEARLSGVVAATLSS